MQAIQWTVAERKIRTFWHCNGNDFCKAQRFVKIFALIEHEHMGPNWTHAEGFILGVGAKMFTIAGPVIVYGTAASAVYGLIDWVFTIL